MNWVNRIATKLSVCLKNLNRTLKSACFTSIWHMNCGVFGIRRTGSFTLILDKRDFSGLQHLRRAFRSSVAAIKISPQSRARRNRPVASSPAGAYGRDRWSMGVLDQ
jgi:hypothetical protein